MQRILLFALMMLGVQLTFGQLDAGNDTTVCEGDSVRLTLTTNFTANLFNNLATVSLSDDVNSQVIDIGFPFEFYGETKTQCVISSNNYLTFDLSQASSGSPWQINNPIPDPGLPLDAIMCPYQDINPGIGGTIEFGTVGSAPNRIFVVRYLGIPMFSCTNLQYCSTILLFEGSNIIETHIENKPLCVTWNNGVAIHGLHNSDGTIAEVVPGRNFPDQWTASAEGTEFVPNGASDYTVTTIPFQLVVSNNNLFWTNANGDTVALGTPTTFAPAATSTFTANLTLCNGTVLTDDLVINVSPPITIDSVPMVQPICGQSNGSISVFASGGNPPYQYSNNGGVSFQASNTFANIPAGLYDIVVRDPIGCSAAMQVDLITDNLPIIDNAILTDPTCLNNDGSITIANSGGIAPIEFSIDNGFTFQSSNVFNTLSGGTYDIVMQDANGCTDTETVTLTTGDGTTIDNVMVVNTLCGLNNGSITITATSPNLPLMFSNDAGVSFQSSNVFSGLSSGNYNLTVRDALGCLAFQNVNVGPSTPITIATPVNVTHTSCELDNGAFTIVATGSVQPYQYSNDNGVTFQNSNSFTGLAAGTYDVVVTNANNCIATTQVVINPYTNPVIDNVVEVDETCTAANGSITINATPGTTAITGYSLDGGINFQAGNAFTGLTAGTYMIVVQDATNCTVTQTVTITNFPPVQIDNVTSTNPTCLNNNGSITLTGMSGTMPFQYSVDGGMTFQASNTFMGLAGGTYDVVIRDANLCEATQQVTLVVIEPVIDNVLLTDEICFNMNGEITVAASMGLPPLMFSINGGTTLQASNTFTGLSGGNYDVVVEDANGCQATQTVTLNNIAGPDIDSVQVIGDPCDQGLGEITVFASNGTPTYEYSIGMGGVFQASNNFSGLADGTYLITVRDLNGCTVTQNVVVFSIAGPNAPTASIIDETCTNSDGQITVQVTGGVSPYMFSIDGGTTFSNNNVFTGLPTGPYALEVVDANGCSATNNVTVGVVDAPEIDTVIVTNPLCNGNLDGSIEIVASGGIAPLEFSIDNGANYQPGNIFNGLGAGVYPVVVRDANLCEVMQSVTLTEPDSLLINLNVFQPSCNGVCDGSASVTVTGGTPPYIYLWSNGNTTDSLPPTLCPAVYTLTVTDANGCTANGSITIVDPPLVEFTATAIGENCNLLNGSIVVNAMGGTGTLSYSNDGGVTFQTGNTFTNLAAGNYMVVVEDENGCQAQQMITVTAIPAPTIDNAVATDETCDQANGTIQVTASGGAAPLTYSVDGTNFQNSDFFDNLAAGTYTVSVQDTAGCLTTSMVTINNIPGPVIDSIASINPTCLNNDGSLTIFATVVAVPAQYSIDGGTTFQMANAFTGLAEGTYNVVVADANGCDISQSVTLNMPPMLTYTAQITNENCDQADGEIQIMATGGSGPYQYSIDGGTTFQPLANFTNLSANTYSIVVIDTSNCEATGTEVLLNVGPPSIDSITVNAVACFGDCNGSATAHISGGLPPYTFEWFDSTGTSLNVFTDTISGLCPGDYIFETTGSGGICIARDTITILEPDSITVNTFALDITCIEAGQISITATGGTGGPYEYSLDNGTTFQDSSVFGMLGPGTYIVTVRDENGCIGTAIDSIALPPPPPEIDSLSVIDPLCNADPSGEVSFFATGEAPLQFSVDSGLTLQSDSVFTGLSAGTFNLTIVDVNGCRTDTQVVLTDPPVLTFTTLNVNATCVGPNGYIEFTATGGVGGYMYSVDGGATFSSSNVITGLAGGTYTVAVRDSNNCQTTNQVTLTEGGGPTVLSVTTTDPSCFGDRDGTITVDLIGNGTIMYSINGGNSFQTSNTFTGLGSGVYNLVLQDSDACITTLTDTLFDPPMVVADFTFDPTLGFVGQDMVFTNNSQNATQYLWEFGDSTSSTLENPIHVYSAGGFYDVMLVAINGVCTDTVWQTIEVLNESELEMPNVFTPNGDGRNDLFRPMQKGVNVVSGFVYNRWGQTIYTWEGPKAGWDGRIAPAGELAPAGTYYYVIVAEGLDGKEHKVQGEITLLR